MIFDDEEDQQLISKLLKKNEGDVSTKNPAFEGELS